MKIKALILGLLVILAAGFYLRGDIVNRLVDVQKVSIDVIKEIEENVFAPSPLRSSVDSPEASLTVSGVIEWTNIQRAENGGLRSLSRDSLLDKAASAKVRDMFEKQYFDHISPDGRGPSDLAETAGYEYLMVGENLALGNFENDKVLVQAWMDSPGHRANILNDKYTEIGVAVGRGLYEGRMTWLAVQEFGRPASDCPRPDTSLKSEIESLDSKIKALEASISQKRAEIESTRPKRGEEYNRKIDEYNELVNVYNELLKESKSLIEVYNAEVKAFNECVQ